MDHNISGCKRLPGQADELDRGSGAAVEEPTPAAEANERKIDDELQRPPADRSPLT